MLTLRGLIQYPVVLLSVAVCSVDEQNQNSTYPNNHPLLIEIKVYNPPTACGRSIQRPER